MALLAEEDSVPRTWRQALHIPQWKQAMVNEKQELEAKGTSVSGAVTSADVTTYS